MRAVDGPLASVRGQRPEEVDYTGAAVQLQRVWIAVRHNLREVTETVTVADLAAGHLPDGIRRLADDPEAWVTR
jgi:DNA-binding IscR family transcriptional regulator